MRLVFDDRSFSYETLRAAAYIPYDGADLGEVLATANRIAEGDTESWWQEWNATADRVNAIAMDCESRGHRESARCGYLRASNYYRTAEFFLRTDPTGVRAHETWRKSVRAFDDAGRLAGPTWRTLRIPYEEGNLTARLYTADTTATPRPTLLFCGGFDSTLEELYFAGAAAAVRHGWNCLTFAGPGQGAVLREQGLPFRADWEAVVAPVVDAAARLPEVDSDRLALMGMSMGGYLAPRAAAFEPRIKAVVAFDGVYDMGLTVRRLVGLPEQGSDTGDDDDFAAAMAADIGLDWLLRNGMWTMQVDAPSKVVAAFEHYCLAGIAERITVPTLVLEAQDDQFFPGQPDEFYDALACPKTLIRFTRVEGAEEHCHMGGLTLFHQRLFDWLDETFANTTVQE